jgi:hypothetical protein
MFNIPKKSTDGECARAEMMLRQVAANAFSFTTLEEFFTIDESLPSEVASQIATLTDVAAALDCWRNKMVAAIDEVVRRYKGDLAT